MKLSSHLFKSSLIASVITLSALSLSEKTFGMSGDENYDLIMDPLSSSKSISPISTGGISLERLLSSGPEEDSRESSFISPTVENGFSKLSQMPLPPLSLSQEPACGWPSDNEVEDADFSFLMQKNENFSTSTKSSNTAEDEDFSHNEDSSDEAEEMGIEVEMDKSHIIAEILDSINDSHLSQPPFDGWPTNDDLLEDGNLPENIKLKLKNFYRTMGFEEPLVTDNNEEVYEDILEEFQTMATNGQLALDIMTTKVGNKYDITEEDLEESLEVDEDDFTARRHFMALNLKGDSFLNKLAKKAGLVSVAY